MRCVLVSHFHWDREWYRDFEQFRSRLVESIDVVLDLCARDPGYRFLLDGQAVVLEDYLALRPDRRAELVAAIRGGRIAVGPWFVQPDSLLPSGEAHVRNLLEGRAITDEIGGGSRVAYVPDSFGHPAQFPQLFAGFGLGPFVYWRGNGDEIDRLGPVWRWVAPDGSSVLALHLSQGYFAAAGLDADLATAAERLAALVERLDAAGADPIVLMNGFDHLPPDRHTDDVAAELEARLGTPVVRGLLDDVAPMLEGRDAPVYEGPLLGARVANLLPGVWSSRMPLKLRNRRCETLLEGWGEPWAALASAGIGGADERAALRLAWRELLCNQAHDSIGGCSTDHVHVQMDARFDTVEGIAEATIARVLERVAGRDVSGALPWSDEQDVVVFNPSPHPRSGVVQVAIDALPPWRASIDRFDLHPLTLLGPDAGFTLDDDPVRVVVSDDAARVRFLPDQPALTIEFVAAEVPAYGCRRYRLRPAPRVPDARDAGTEIAAGDVAVRADADGTLTVRLGDRELRGLFAIEDRGDRGESYDFDPLPGDESSPVVTASSVERTVHPTGIQRLRVEQHLALPASLDDERAHRRDETVECRLTLDALVAPGVPSVEVTVTFENAARDHRLRLCFPTGAPTTEFQAASTFEAATWSTTPPDATSWLHPAPRTVPVQGWVRANGVVVGAPGLPEAEVGPDGTIFVTLVRSVGWLSRYDLASRPMPAGPQMPAPDAQVLGPVTAAIVIARDPAAARDAELGLRGVLGGPDPRLADGEGLLRLEPRSLVLSACKPAASGEGIVVRVLNPGDEECDAELTAGFDVASAEAVRLDETPTNEPLSLAGRAVRLSVPPHALRSVLIIPARRSSS